VTSHSYAVVGFLFHAVCMVHILGNTDTKFKQGQGVDWIDLAQNRD
jgi:hypothetical protein